MIELNIPNGNLGDTVLTTALFKNNREGLITLLDMPQLRRFESLFYGFNVKIQYKPNIQSSIVDNRQKHLCQQYLDHFGIIDNPIPQINVNIIDYFWAENYLSQYKNPLVITTNVGGTGDKSNYWAQYRTFNPILMNELLEEYSKKYTLLHFGLSRDFLKKNYENEIDSFIKAPNCVEILDLPLNKLSACYKVIGKYFGLDTGDYHLMTAVGGKCNTLINDHHEIGYNYRSYIYTQELFGQEKMRIKYTNFKNYKDSLKWIDFDY